MSNLFDDASAILEKEYRSQNIEDNDVFKSASSILSEQYKSRNDGFIEDTVTDLKKGTLQIPSIATGLGDAALGVVGFDRPLDKATDWVGEKTGFQPSKSAEKLAPYYSEGRQSSDAAIEQAWADPNTGGLDVAGAYLANPRSTLGNITASLPSMIAGGLAGRFGFGLKAAAEAVKAGTMTQAEFLSLAAKAGAVGEGGVMAGQAMDSIDKSVDPQKAGLASLGVGVIGGAIGYGSGRVANRYGFGDIDTAMVSGGEAGLANSAHSMPTRLAVGALQEGPIEEGLQSIVETGSQNLAEGNPVEQGMARNFVEGSIAGTAMGGGINAFSEAKGVIGKAINAGTQAKPHLAQPNEWTKFQQPGVDPTEIEVRRFAKGMADGTIDMQDFSATAFYGQYKPQVDKAVEFFNKRSQQAATDTQEANSQNWQSPSFRDIPDAEAIVRNRTVQGVDTQQAIDDQYQPTGISESDIVQAQDDQQNTSKKTPFDNEFEESAQRHGVPVDLLKAVAEQESGFRQFDKSGKPLTPGTSNALGVMQIIPKWHPEFDAEKLASDPAYNIDAGAQFLSQLLKQTNGDEKAALKLYFGSKDNAQNEQYADSVLNRKTGESTYVDQGNNESAQPDFKPTHTLSDGTHVRQAEDFEGNPVFEDDQGNWRDFDNSAEPINADSDTGSNATLDTGTTAVDRGASTEDSGAGSSIEPELRSDVSGGVTGNADGLPGEVDQPSDSVDRGTLAESGQDPILTTNKTKWVVGQLKEKGIKSTSPGYKDRKAELEAQYEVDLIKAFDGAPYEIYANHPENAKVPESAKRTGWKALQTNAGITNEQSKDTATQEASTTQEVKEEPLPPNGHASKQPNGKYKLLFAGTNNEVFPGELFNSPREAKNYLDVARVKQKERLTKATQEDATTQKVEQGKQGKVRLNVLGLPVGSIYKGDETVEIKDLSEGDWVVINNGNPFQITWVKDNGDGTFNVGFTDHTLTWFDGDYSGSKKIKRKLVEQIKQQSNTQATNDAGSAENSESQLNKTGDQSSNGQANNAKNLKRDIEDWVGDYFGTSAYLDDSVADKQYIEKFVDIVSKYDNEKGSREKYRKVAQRLLTEKRPSTGEYLHFPQHGKHQVFSGEEMSQLVSRIENLQNENSATKEVPEKSTGEVVKDSLTTGKENPPIEKNIGDASENTSPILNKSTDNTGGKTGGSDNLPGEEIFVNQIKIAADSVEKLRKQDVFRVIDDLASPGVRKKMGDYIKKYRPDLNDEVDLVLSEIDNKKPELSPSTVDNKAKSEEMQELDKEIDNVLSDLGAAILSNISMKAVAEDKVYILPIVSKLMGLLVKKGYVTFKENSSQVLSMVRSKFGDDAAEQINLKHLQGAYIFMTGDSQEQGLDGLFEVGAVKSLDEINNYVKTESDETKADTDQDKAETQPSADINFASSKAFAERLLAGESFKTIVQARKALTSQPIESGTELAKKADEAIELAGVLAARKIVENGRKASKRKTQVFDELVKLAEQMPSLNVRSSTSIAQQAYSTPLPLAYVASVRAGINLEKTVVEPTGGNGALLIGADPDKTVVNELNPDRYAALLAQGFEAINKDATTFNFGNADTDVVIANPPFGVVRDDDGNSITFTISADYKTNEIDHAIALNSLKAMANDGKAVLIVGGPAKTLTEKGRSDAYNGKAKRAFYYTLYNEYNVTDHFTVSGDLYAKQGAAWPVDVIVIDGRGKSSLRLPAADLPRLINSIEELKNELKNNRPSLQQTVVTVDEANSNETETGDAGNELGNSADGFDGRVDQDGQPGELLPGSGASTEEYGQKQSDNADKRNDRASRRSNGTSNGNDAVKNKYQAEYTPASSVNPVGTLVPVNMQASTETALQRIIDKHGDIDEFIAKQLDYKKDDIGKYFSAEQVDAIALALDNIINGKGFIIGDQTGVGKGRVNAAMIRYAIKNKLTPVFVTEKPNLYGDMIRDLADIGMDKIKPFPTNTGFSIPLDQEAQEWYAASEKAKENGEKPPAKYGKFINSPGGSKHTENMQAMINSGELVDADVIFTTYSQMQTVAGGRTVRMDFLEKMADGGLVILDESHNAGGTSVTMKRGKNAPDVGEKTGRAAVARKLVELAKGVFYSSATYAKRPDVLDLYSKTDMGLVADAESLKDSLVAGGVPLQQAVASMLAKAGQYIRREKSFDGIVYDTVIADVDRAFAEKASEVMREIMKFDTLKAAAVEAIGSDLKAEASTIRGDMSTGQVGAQSSNFTSVMHNMISQMLLTLKVQPTIEEALAALKRNEKPVIALSNTMGSAIDEYVADAGLNPGDAIGLNFGDLLKRYAFKSRRVTTGNAFGKKTVRELTDQELGPVALAQFKKILKLVDGFDYGKYPISAIDAIHAALAREGYKSGEITGRQSMIDYSGSGVNIPASFPTTFKTKNDDKDSVRRFQDYAKAKKETSDMADVYKKGAVVELGFGDEVGVTVGDVKDNGENWFVPVMDDTGEVFIIATAFIKPTGETKDITKDYQKELNAYHPGSFAEKGAPIYKRRPAQQTTAAGKRKTINDFNNGLLDVIILNQSGATGLSLHASPKVGGDTRKRHMIIAQPELNIDTHMQMLGRINRTGQIILPSYAQLTANIPAEKRPSAILAKKMAMLNANTTAGKDSAVKAKDVPDFMNDYGDDVAAAVMNDNRDIHKKLGKPLSEAQSGGGFEKEGAMRKITGRIPVLSLKEQEELYQLIEDEYNEYIDMLTKTGQNQLEAQAMDLDAKIKTVTPVVEAIDNTESPFAEGVNAETVDVKKLGKPYTFDQITDLIAKQGITDAETGKQFSDKMKEEIKAAYEKRAAEINLMPEDEANEIRRKTGAMDLLNHQRQVVEQVVERYRPGKGVLLVSPKGNEFYGITGKIERKGDSKNYFALGQWKLTIYVADAAKSFVIPLSKYVSQLGGVEGWSIQYANLNDVKSALAEGESVTRETRTILTGNMLAAYGFDKSGQIVNYTKDTGEVNQGVLMPKTFKLEQAIAAKPVVFTSADMAIEFAQNEKNSPSLRSGDNSVRLLQNGYRAFQLYVPASKARGGAIFTNKRLIDSLGDFYKRGSEMVVPVPLSKVEETLRILYPITGAMQPISKETGKAFLESKGIKYSKGQSTGSTVAEVTNMLPKRVKAMLDAGKVRIVQSHGNEQVEAYYDSNTDTIVLVADNISKDLLNGVLAHELFHRALTTDPEIKAALDRFEAQLQRSFDHAANGRGSQAEKNAYARVIAAETPTEDQLEEYEAYLITEHERNPDSLSGMVRKAIQDFIATVRVFLIRNGLDAGFIKSLTPADLAAFSRYGAQVARVQDSGVSSSVMASTKLAELASWGEDRINRLMSEFAYAGENSTTKGYAVYISPEDFLKATTVKDDVDWLESEKTPLDKNELKNQIQAIFLIVDQSSDGVFNINGHEGRHRMMALRDAGIERVPVVLRVSTVRNAKAIEEAYFNKQNFGDGYKGQKGFYARNITPISYEYLNDLRADFGKKTDVMFSTNSDGNTGDFNPNNPDIRYSKLSDLQTKAQNAIVDHIKTKKTFNWWHKTVGTQFHKALIDKSFGRVFAKSMQFEQDLARMANEAADMAPSLLPQLSENPLKIPSEIRKGYVRNADAKKVADAIFKTTLQDKRLSDQELQNEGYTDDQRTMYREFFAAVNKSLDDLAKSEMFRAARALKLIPAPELLGLTATGQYYYDQVTGPVQDKIDEVTALWKDKQAEIRKFRNAARTNALKAIGPYMTEEARQRAQEARAEFNSKLKPLLEELKQFKLERKAFIQKAASIEKMKANGYAPLMRFGQYTVDVVETDPITNVEERVFFGMFESEANANKAARDLQSEYPWAKVTQGVMSQNDWQMFRGITPETMEVFARMFDVEQEDVFQKYLATAVNNRSAMKRLIHRKKMEGFESDPQRVLATFITSNARAASKNIHLGEMVDAITSIDKTKGDVIDEAVNLYNFVQNPAPAGAGLRNLLFIWYLGGSFASALVNMTQTFTTTLPYLHQFGSTKQVASHLTRAVGLAVSTKPITGDLGAAMKRAEEEGVTAPHELNMLYGESMRTGFMMSQHFRPLSKAWGSLFSAAESYNRRVAFIAAYNLAKETGKPNPFKFASDAVDQTQFVYTKSSRPNWARSTLGSAIFTFKTFSISYMEFLKRLPPQEKLIAMAVLVLFAGVGGLPGEDDAEDIADTIGQALGYNTNAKAWKENLVEDLIGKEAANYALRGVSAGLPFDISSRLGVNNLIPGTGILKKSEKDKSRDVMEFAGAAGDLGAKVVEAFDAASSREGVGSFAKTMGKSLLPKAIQDAMQSVNMIQTGMYKDMRGRKVADTSDTDALFKGIGLQPTAVADKRRQERLLNQTVTLVKEVESDIADLWAQGVFEKDNEKITEARSLLRKWNQRNEDTPIRIDLKQITKRVKQMNLTSGDRLMKTTPKELRKFAQDTLN